MPERWTVGRRYRFEARCRPVVRVSNAEARGLPRECDVFRVAVHGVPKEMPIDRSAVYRKWLCEEFCRRGGAEPADVRMRRFRLEKVFRRRKNAEGRTEKRATITGPDVTFVGTLAITDSDKFTALLARGLGRHRAFGFGMLLLAPGG